MVQEWYKKHITPLSLVASGALFLTTLCIFSFPIYMIGFASNFDADFNNIDQNKEANNLEENFIIPQVTRFKLTNIVSAPSTNGQVTVNLIAKDNLVNILTNLNTDLREIEKFNKLVKSHKYQKITLTLAPVSNSGKMVIEKASMIFNQTQKREFFKENNTLRYQDSKIPLVKKIVPYSATIRTNLVNALKASGLSKSQITELVNAYSYSIDFQRGINLGAKVTLLIEKFENDEHRISQHGKVLFVSLESKGKQYKLYWYEVNGKSQYFTEQGKTTKRLLLKSPLNVTKISSGFGLRKSPFGGFSAMHKGIDFSAPTGTPIYAAGEGMVSAIGWLNGYGKYIEIKHDKHLTTRYAHISKFAQQITKGTRLKQGEVIAYVGATGRATGPHLHYEVRLDGKPVDPMKIKTTPHIALQGQALAKFEQFKYKLSKQFGLPTIKGTFAANN